MGATLPAVSRWVETTPEGISRLGLFYAGNIAGAVFGSLFAGFYLLRVYDMRMATYVAVALNVAGGDASRWCSRASRTTIDAESRSARGEESCFSGALCASPRSSPSSFDASAVYLAIALSGFCALAGEVIWTRLLGLLFGATVYTFSLILAVFLIGLGIGSGARLGAVEAGQSASGLRLVPDARGGRHRVDGARARAVAAVLADQSRPSR